MSAKEGEGAAPLLEYMAVELRTSPHIRNKESTEYIMKRVILALMPVCLASMYLFGLSAVFLLITTTISCVLTELLLCKVSRRDNTLRDKSAIITGVLLGLTLPPGFPLWMAFVGGVTSIILGKAIFGGLGFNMFNPALVGRAFLQASFPAAITTWIPHHMPNRFVECIPTTFTLPFSTPDIAAITQYTENIDGWTGATPLMMMKATRGLETFYGSIHPNMFDGLTAGSAGETSAIMILIGGLYLLSTKTMDWRIPTAVLGSVFVLSGIFWFVNPTQYPDPLMMLFSGGLMLGAFFMATDMVTSPTTPRGMWVFGILAGCMTVMIRLFGSLPEGVMYSILFANAVTPLINRFTQPRVFGAGKVKAKA